MPVPMIEANQFGVRFANRWLGCSSSLSTPMRARRWGATGVVPVTLFGVSRARFDWGASVMLMFFSVPGLLEAG